MNRNSKNSAIRIVIMGAAGRDFHNFNVVYRDDPMYRVVAFTATQIPDITGRLYPAALAGKYYPNGIPIVEESELGSLCRNENIERVIFAYSDIEHAHVMHKASIALAAGADFVLLGPEHTMLKSKMPVIATSAVRTGCGKSQTTRWLSRLLKQHGFRIAVIRHPMPYGDLEQQAVQRFANKHDLDQANCTVEEREEYEPHIEIGNIVFAGVDYREILSQAESEADVILWDGGNNDFPFLKPDLHLVLVDPLRSGNETSHHPGETVLRMADIIVVAKTNSASDAQIQKVSENSARINPQATIVRSASAIKIEGNHNFHAKRVLVIEDGPSITHGGMPYGAAYVAATQAQVAEIVDPRRYAVEEISKVYQQYPHIGPVLPAVGYHHSQLKALQDTINAMDVDFVLSATPCNLSDLIKINKPIARVFYEFEETGEPKLSQLVEQFCRKHTIAPK